jgi:hypothetical protein
MLSLSSLNLPPFVSRVERQALTMPLRVSIPRYRTRITIQPYKARIKGGN